MNTKSLLERLGKLNIVRLRIFNFKLVNNLRFSLFKEISSEDIRNFIRDYRNLGEAGAERNAVVNRTERCRETSRNILYSVFLKGCVSSIMCMKVRTGWKSR